MAPVVPGAPCLASRPLMSGVHSQPIHRPRTPPAVRRPPRRARRPKPVAVAAIPSRTPRRRPARSPPPVTIARRRQSQPLPVLRRTTSEPALPSWSEDDEAGDATALPRFSTCTDVCSPGILALSPPSTSSSPPKSQEGAAAAAAGAGGKRGRYTEDSKVVVTVTVEGCPGPVRALVRLGATVDETMAIVAEIYRKEGRRPRLDDDAGGRGEESLQLYHSYFCLQGLNKTDRLGDVGGRSFYMRRGGTISGTNTAASWSQSSTIGGNVPDGRFGSQMALLGGAQSCLIVSFLVKRLGKIGRRGRKIWNMLGCIASD